MMDQLEQHIVQLLCRPHGQRDGWNGVFHSGATKPAHTPGGETSTERRTLLLQFLSYRLMRVPPEYSVPDERVSKSQGLQRAHDIAGKICQGRLRHDLHKT